MADTEMVVAVVSCVFQNLYSLCKRLRFLLSFFFRPDLTIKKRRGGKRMRRLKERFEETAMMKQANTRAFSGLDKGSAGYFRRPKKCRKAQDETVR
jgi:hypothetical protein